jgi:hypothetical protein
MRRVSLEEQAKLLEKRKLALGFAGTGYVALNPGLRRTESKRALLRAIDEAGIKTGLRSNGNGAILQKGRTSR